MKKSDYILAVICAIFFVVCSISLFFDFKSSQVSAKTSGFHVVLDAGHGGRDGGASSPSGIFERDINLAIVKFMESEFKRNGVDVTLTRKNIDSLANPLARNQKRSDMDERRKIIERAKPDLVISIHLNSLPSHPGVRGLQTFFDKTGEKSKAFATAIQNHFNASNLDINRRAAVGDFYILECTSFPSVLVECGFLSNTTEERLLKSKEYQKILANGIVNAVLSCK